MMERLLIFIFFVLELSSSSNAEYYIRPDYSEITPLLTKSYRLQKYLPDLDTQENREVRISSRSRQKYEVNEPSEDSDDNDGNLYTVGTRIRVTHPAPEVYSQPKQINQAVAGFSSLDEYSGKQLRKKTTKRPQSIRPSYAEDYDRANLLPLGSHALDPLAVPRDFGKPIRSQKAPNYYPEENDFKGVASKKQIDQYLEDQQKLVEEAIKFQILNDPSPLAIGKYQQFLKSQQDERIEKEYEKELNAKQLFSPNTNNAPRRPRKKESNRQKKKSSNRRPQGLGSYRVPRGSNRVRLSLDI